MSGHITSTRVARAPVVGEQAEQHLAEYVDLPGDAVAGVHLIDRSQGR
jgi:hypothetical protein